MDFDEHNQAHLEDWYVWSWLKWRGLLGLVGGLSPSHIQTFDFQAARQLICRRGDDHRLYGPSMLILIVFTMKKCHVITDDNTSAQLLQYKTDKEKGRKFKGFYE